MTTELSIALDRYDRHFPFFDGTAIAPPGFALKPFQVGQSARLKDGTDRHEEFLQGTYDVAEFSMSSFLMAKDQGYPIVGIPVFPRRLFSQSQMWVHPDSSIQSARELGGQRVALSAFQTTLSLLAKGDLTFYYGVPWQSIQWKLTTREKIPLEHGPEVSVEFIGDRDRLGERLHSGEIDAFFLPHPPHDVMIGRTPARRLFRDPEAEEDRYYADRGYFPIMHVVVIQEAVADAYPDLPRALMTTFHHAFDVAMGYYEDPNWSMLAGGRHYWELEQARFKGSPWTRGFNGNRANIEMMIRYAMDQGMVHSALTPEALFHASTWET